jgi:hypothetical protein
MRYTAQLRLHGDELPAQLGEIISWFGDRGLRPGPFQYRSLVTLFGSAWISRI